MNPTDLRYGYLGLDLTKLELHAESDGMRTMVGYATAFDFPIPGDQGETVYIKPRSLNYALQHHRDRIGVLYDHGRDGQIGSKPLGSPRTMEPDKTGLWTETPLAKTAYNEQIVIPLLESGAVRSMSIAFAPTQQTWSDDRTERYVEQMALFEFGPTPNPRNLGATAAIHSRSPLDVLELEEHWDGAAALRSASTAAEFRQIAFERNNDSDPDTAAHWGLPHHSSPGAGPDPGGVAAALQALGGSRTGTPIPESTFKMTNAAIRSHLENHQGEASSASGDRGSTELGGTAEALENLTEIRREKRLEEYARILSTQGR